MLIYQTRPPTAVTQKPQMKRKRKGSRDFPFRVGNMLAAGVSRASSTTWALSARPLVLHVHRAPACASPITSLHHGHGLGPVLGGAFSPASLSDSTHTHFLVLSLHSRSFLSSSTLFRSSLLQHFSPPSFGRVWSISANRVRTRPPPPAFLVTMTGSFLCRMVDVLAVFLSCTPPP